MDILVLADLVGHNLDLLREGQLCEVGIVSESSQDSLDLGDGSLGLWALWELGKLALGTVSLAGGDYRLDLLDELRADTFWDLGNCLLRCELEGDVLGKGWEGEALWETAVGLVGLDDSLGLLDDGSVVEVLGRAGDGDLGDFSGGNSWCLESGKFGLESLEIEFSRADLGLDGLEVEVRVLGLEGLKVEVGGELGLQSLEVKLRCQLRRGELRRSWEVRKEAGKVKVDVWAGLLKVAQKGLQLGDLNLPLFLGDLRELRGSTLAGCIFLDDLLDLCNDFLNHGAVLANWYLTNGALEVERRGCGDNWGRHLERCFGVV
jgi:hypothetical protein